ncbi:MAG: YkgJ family cysteine cluster protein [Candidatus Omnitrophota bacterium]
MSPARPDNDNAAERSNGVSEFQCLCCGDCCRWGGYVYITEDDVKRISGYLSMTEFDFVNTYAEMIHRPRLTLKTKKDGSCIVQDGNVCSIHPVKPKQCSDFPDFWRIKDIESFCNGHKRSPKDTGRP